MKYIKRELANERYLVADTDTGVEEIFTKSALQEYVESGVEVWGCNLNTGNIYPLFWRKNGEKVTKDDFLYLGEWRKEYTKFIPSALLMCNTHPEERLGVSAGVAYAFAVFKGLQTALNGENLRFGGTLIETDEGLIMGIHKNSEMEVRYKRDFSAIKADIKARKTHLQQEIEIFITYGKGKFKKTFKLSDTNCDIFNFIDPDDKKCREYRGYTDSPYKLDCLSKPHKYCFPGYEITEIGFNFLEFGFSPLKRLNYAKLKLEELKPRFCECRCVQGDWKFYEKNYKDWQNCRVNK